MRFTMKHYYDFKELNPRIGQSLHHNPAAWDVLRKNEDKLGGVFGIPEDRRLWEQKNNINERLNSHAQSIVDILGSRYNQLDSCGVGGGGLEYLIKKRNPRLYLRCSDFAAGTVNRLKEVFKEADEIIEFDMLKGSWQDHGDECITLLYYVDAVFSDKEWNGIFEHMHKAGIKHVLFIPVPLLTFRRFVKQQFKYFIYRLLGRKLIFTSYLRTETRLKELFRGYFCIDREFQTREFRGYLLKRSESKWITG